LSCDQHFHLSVLALQDFKERLLTAQALLRAPSTVFRPVLRTLSSDSNASTAPGLSPSGIRRTLSTAVRITDKAAFDSIIKTSLRDAQAIWNLHGAANSPFSVPHT
jgi:hypothetical protein